MSPAGPRSHVKAPRPDAPLLDEMVALAPWHIEVPVTAELSTRDAWETARRKGVPGGEPQMDMYSPEPAWTNLLRSIYPQGLAGRSILDCACNCGAYSFIAKEQGAGECFGFDVRDHWINQARFLAEHREAPTDRMRFEVLDLYDMPERGIGPFDLAFFLGIFYHLPNPIGALKTVTDLTREVVVLDTATRNDLPDGSLFAAEESTSHALSGAYGLHWFPTGPKVLRKVFGWLGFPEMRVVYRRRDTAAQPPELGRLRIVAAREPGRFDAFDAQRKPGKAAPNR
jgi:tRNA (mo5U34)-methyltransferase